ncbi:MAG TPA: hypothetical protein VGH89_34825 [Pseudonocardia sp.]|jgi:hypothetical protein
MTSDRLQVPGSALRSLSPSWFTRAVRARYPGAVVSRVEVLNVSRGTTTRVRVKLSYSQGQGPGQVFVKAQGRLGHRLMLLAIGMLYAEARFYAQVQDLPVPVPSLVAAATNRSTLSSVVVLEDIPTPGDAQRSDQQRKGRPRSRAHPRHTSTRSHLPRGTRNQVRLIPQRRVN